MTCRNVSLSIVFHKSLLFNDNAKRNCGKDISMPSFPYIVVYQTVVLLPLPLLKASYGTVPNVIELLLKSQCWLTFCRPTLGIPFWPFLEKTDTFYVCGTLDEKMHLTFLAFVIFNSWHKKLQQQHHSKVYICLQKMFAKVTLNLGQPVLIRVLCLFSFCIHVCIKPASTLLLTYDLRGEERSNKLRGWHM